MRRVLFASLQKEFLLISRDIHGLLVLFVMPTAFILIMSMATQNSFNNERTNFLPGTLKVAEHSNATDYFLNALSALNFTKIVKDETGRMWFSIELTQAFEQTVTQSLQPVPAIIVTFSPELGVRERALVKANIAEAFALTNVYFLAINLGYDEAYARTQFLKQGAIQVKEQNASRFTKQPITPNATQQNVPAWLVFAMFFISIPISTTMIAERRQKTLLRLRTMALSPSILYLAKLLPYLLINGVQLVLMILVGRYILPTLGGEALNLDISITALSLLGFCVSFAALGYAALIATLCKTIEQATIISGVGSILFGALGGVMVPKFIMPTTMQAITKVSPMGWGLEGFLEIFVHQGALSSIIPQCSALLGFGALLLALALSSLKINTDHM